MSKEIINLNIGDVLFLESVLSHLLQNGSVEDLEDVLEEPIKEPTIESLNRIRKKIESSGYFKCDHFWFKDKGVL